MHSSSAIVTISCNRWKKKRYNVEATRQPGGFDRAILEIYKRCSVTYKAINNAITPNAWKKP
jgi:hypothetical protein